jgi:hypothetical protein
MSPRNPPLNRRGVEQILATTPDVTLVVKATSDGKLEVSARCFNETIKILEGERLEVRNHGNQVCVLRRKAA